MSRIRTLAGILAPLFLAACGTPSRDSPLQVDDSGLIPSLRLSIAPGDATPNEPRSGFAFELGVSKASGSGTQNLVAGERASSNGRTLIGPAQLANHADARFIDALARFRLGPSAETPLGLELIGGLADLSFNFTAGSLGNSQHTTLGVLGIGGLVRLGPTSALHARYTSGANVDSDEVRSQRFEIAWVQAFGRNFAGRAGYAAWSITRTPPAPDSEMRMRVAGPFLGLELSF